MRIQHNITAMNAYRNYNNNTSAIGKNLEKLSSGYKINRAGDDAAGLAVSQKMRLQIAGLAQAQKNAKSGISYVQTAEGALQEVHEMLERMYTLAEQSANGTFDSSTDRTQLQKEVNSLMEEIDRIGKTANFNGMGIFKQYVKPGATTTTTTATPATIAEGTNSFTAATSLPEGVSEVKATDATKLSAGEVKVQVTEATAVTASGAKFEVDLSGVSAGVETGKTYKLTIGSASIEGNTSGTNAAALAGAFDTKKITIDDLEYTISVSGSKLTFTAANGANTALANDTAVTIGAGDSNAPTGSLTGADALKTSNKADGKDKVDEGKWVTITNGTNTDKINIATASWTSTVTVTSDKLGLSFKYDTSKTSLNTQQTIGTVTASGGNTPPRHFHQEV